MIHPFADHLAELSRRDPRRQVFGASQHQYHSRPVPEQELLQVEAELGVALPPEYRDFMLLIGRGAGPYYGLWGPVGSANELRNQSENWTKYGGKPIRASAPFPFTAADLRELDAKRVAVGEPVFAEHAWPCDGCMPICDQGCAYSSVLVLAGEFAGSVFNLNNPGYSEGEWLPAWRPPGLWERGTPAPRELPPLPQPPTFNEWVYGWIERCLADLPAGQGLTT
jgi:hypothetical protein